MIRTKIFHAFTDGACKPNPGVGGWGWVFMLPIGNTTIRFMNCGGKNRTTNNEMELTAMLKCIQFLPKKNTPYKVIIFTDSQYVLLGLVSKENGVVGQYPHGRYRSWELDKWKVKGCKDRLNSLLWQKVCQECCRCFKDGIELEIKWVKGHAGDEGNELADYLANRGVSKN